ncbi:glucan 1,6-alpha-glucosidase [Sporosarcina globispora]|uniref:Glucan 1,6-alpha-glucosidase n=1 Tax=Sporosarcina globispora TaxID=1459 RepID=A0A0M0GFR6_SPOGL|nr:alpha-glucosidase [Sporosarcina globispora]KON88760.1 glucan 1,6-alpha-glucosidase [Sporosarcina globispora]
MEMKWWHKSVIYQVYPRSFKDSDGDGIGDLAGLISRLDYIAELGADLIWLCPVYASPNDDNGYDISDYYSIHPEYGSMDDMDRLISEAATRGIGIMMDIVANHTSDEHPWFVESKSSKENPYRDFYVWKDGLEDGPPSGLQSIFSGSAWEYDPMTAQYYLHMFSKKQPDLNWHHPTVRQAIYDVMRFWIKKGIKGFRFDVIDLIAKDLDQHVIANGPLLHEYLQEMHQEVLEGTDVVTIGETGGADLNQAILFTDPSRKELDMVFSFEHIALDELPGKQKWDLKPLKLGELKHVLSSWQTGLSDNGWNSLFWSNHDQPRIVSRWGNDVDFRYESATMLAALLHLMKGTPYIYQGEEIGMTNIKFPDLDSYRDIETLNMYFERIAAGYHHESIMNSIYVKGRDNARTPMQWNTDKNAGFTDGVPWIDVNPNYISINAACDLDAEQSIFRFYKKLIQLRKSNDIIVYGDYRLLESEPEIYAYERRFKGEKWLIICNFTEKEVRSPLLSSMSGNLLIHNYLSPPGDQKLRPYEAVVYKIKN